MIALYDPLGQGSFSVLAEYNLNVQICFGQFSIYVNQ